MFICPICNIPLKPVHNVPGISWQCPSCDGRSATLALLRRYIPGRIINTLWQSARSGNFPRKLICPGCANRMVEVPATSERPKPCLDVCTRCQTLWFDCGELEAMPAFERRPDRYEGLSLEAREKLALLEIKMAREGAGNESFAEYRPDNWWEWVIGLLGMPIEQDTKDMRTAPLVTWSLAAAITAISVFAFIALPTAVRDYGFIPADPLRYGGLTLLTSFLLHGSILHLVGNLYFLLIFGDNVEAWLGRRKFLLLILCATVAGDLLHFFGNASSNTPCIGASGGVSGILAFYALTFPHAKLGFLMRFYLWFRWITLPAYGLFALWIILQFVGAWMQVSGFSHVAALAHLGGAGVGLIFWLAHKKWGQTSLPTKSPLDITGINTDISTDESVSFVRESRET